MGPAGVLLLHLPLPLQRFLLPDACQSALQGGLAQSETAGRCLLVQRLTRQQLQADTLVPLCALQGLQCVLLLLVPALHPPVPLHHDAVLVVLQRLHAPLLLVAVLVVLRLHLLRGGVLPQTVARRHCRALHLGPGLRLLGCQLLLLGPVLLFPLVPRHLLPAPLLPLPLPCCVQQQPLPALSALGKQPLLELVGLTADAPPDLLFQCVQARGLPPVPAARLLLPPLPQQLLPLRLRAVRPFP